MILLWPSILISWIIFLAWYGKLCHIQLVCSLMCWILIVIYISWFMYKLQVWVIIFLAKSIIGIFSRRALWWKSMVKWFTFWRYSTMYKISVKSHGISCWPWEHNIISMNTMSVFQFSFWRIFSPLHFLFKERSVLIFIKSPMTIRRRCSTSHIYVFSSLKPGFWSWYLQRLWHGKPILFVISIWLKLKWWLNMTLSWFRWLIS